MFQMRYTVIVVAAIISVAASLCEAWMTPMLATSPITSRPVSPTSTQLHAKRKMAKKQQDRSRPNKFYDAINEAKGEEEPKTGKKKKGKKKPKEQPSAQGEPLTPAEAQLEAERQARNEAAQKRMDERPEVSTMIVDEETGIEVVAQGKSVMDVVTRKAVKLSDLGPEYRLAQMFPGVPPDVCERYRLNKQTVEVPEMVEALRAACSVKGEIPPHPSVANKAIDFVLANRDLLGREMKNTLGRITMRNMSLGNKEQAAADQALWKNFLTLENHISAPFRQMIMDAEGRCGPNFGNLDLKSYAGGELYERCANYLVLKSMVAHWEKKVIDADYTEKTPQTKDNYMRVLARGDPKRYLPDPPILFTLRECTQVCLMAQQLTKAFVEDAELFGDFPPELRFLEQALSVQGGTPLRKFMIEDFCPAEGITPDALREGMRRLLAQLDNMQIDPYGDICNLLERLLIAMSVGTDDERDPYLSYLANKDPNGPGAFQSYTFNHEKLSLVRFLDSQYDGGQAGGITKKAPAASGGGGLGGLFNFGSEAPAPAPPPETTPATQDDWVYKVPEARAAGRPHELGWLEMLDDEKKERVRLGKVPPGRIIMDDE